jgi:putative DNA primase/helicase
MSETPNYWSTEAVMQATSALRVKAEVMRIVEGQKPEPYKKRLVQVAKGALHLATDETQRALLAAHCPIYYRAGGLVEPMWRYEKTADTNRQTLVCRFVRLNIPRLQYMVAKHAASYQKFDARTKKWVNTDPPRDMLEQLLELERWDFPTAKGIINTPTMRPDGSLLVQPGYDAVTQLWYMPSCDVTLPPIPESPTRQQALAALELLKEPLKNFPFVGEKEKNVSLSVALAALITPVVRGAFEFAPLFLITSPESGTGKTYLIWVFGTLATGQLPAATVAHKKEEEMEKRLSAAAFEADPITHLNNLDADLDSALLCQMVSDGIVKVRPFGRNDQLIRCDCRGMTVYANGNNVCVVGDLVRRTLKVRMNAKVEDPETRTFKFDPIDMIKAERGKYLAAVFTIVRAYMAAGCPDQKVKPFNGYDGWSRMVRYPLLWLGEADPVESTLDARRDDPQREGLRLRIKALWDAFAESAFTAADIYKKASIGDEQLRAAFAHSDGGLNTKSIGKQLSADLDRYQGGFMISRVKEDSVHGHGYVVVKEEEQGSLVV